MNKNRIFLSSPTMHGEEQSYIREAFETNWIAPLGLTWTVLRKKLVSTLEVRMQRH